RGDAPAHAARHHKLAVNLQHALNPRAGPKVRWRRFIFVARDIGPRNLVRGSTGHCKHEHPCSRHWPPSRFRSWQKEKARQVFIAPVFLDERSELRKTEGYGPAKRR